MTLELARGKAAQAWCEPETMSMVMIPELAEAFAKIIDEIWNQAWLGNATTRELLAEIEARIGVAGNLDYKTAKDLEEDLPPIDQGVT